MSSVKQSLYNATSKLLRPIVRMLLRKGVSHSEFVEIAKRVYVDEAYDSFMIPGRKKTVSRAAVLTGLSRKEVLRLTMDEEIQQPRKGSINRANRVINGWLRDKEFQDKDGNALHLPLTGNSSSFASLVKKYSGDITAGAVLDELIRVGVIKKKDDEFVELVAQGYVPQEDQEEKIRIMGNCATDFLNTVDHNLESKEEEVWFQRHVVYSHLPKEVIPVFKKMSKEKSTKLLIELNQWLAEKDVVSNPDAVGAAEVRAGLGIYYFEEDKADLEEKS